MKINESMELFLDSLTGRLSAKTIDRYKDVLWLFKDYLAGYGELSHEEAKDGSIVLTAQTRELTDGQVENFLGWFLIRKVMGPAWLNTAAPGIMKKYIKWLDREGLLAEGAMEEAFEITKKATKDLPRVEKAANLLYALCKDNGRRLDTRSLKDDDYMEGYGKVSGIIEDKLYLDYEGEKTGPIQITREIAKCLKKGDTVNLVVGRKGRVWLPLEVGNVYPGD